MREKSKISETNLYAINEYSINERSNDMNVDCPNSFFLH